MGSWSFDFVSMERAPPMCITAGNEAVRALIHLVIADSIDLRKAKDAVLTILRRQKLLFGMRRRRQSLVVNRKGRTAALTPPRVSSPPKAAGESPQPSPSPKGERGTKLATTSRTLEERNASSAAADSSHSRTANHTSITDFISKPKRGVKHATRGTKGLDNPDSPEYMLAWAKSLVKEHTKRIMAQTPEERSAPQDKAQQLQTMRLRFALLKAVSVETFLRHDQVASVLEALKTVPDAARCRQEAVVIFYARMARPKQRFGHILSRLTMPELLVVAHRLGWRNIISWHLPDLSYKFFLNRPDEYECAERLAKMAVNTKGKQVWQKLLVNGKPLNIPEDHAFWNIASGGEFHEDRTLEFTYESPLEVFQTNAATVIQAAWRRFVAYRHYKRLQVANYVIAREWIKFKRLRRKNLALRHSERADEEALAKKNLRRARVISMQKHQGIGV
mmetsp:Transcript_40842/g.76428  ORF Transcript_40842/g.76428 Transcript_40842/m.76428 type:complete len:448 (+) Transcript_40842:3-1346(+)